MSTNRQGYTLNYSSKHAYEVLQKISPYLVRKLPETQSVFDFSSEGKMDMRTGTKLMPEEIWKIRECWYKKLQRMK